MLKRGFTISLLVASVSFPASAQPQAHPTTAVIEGTIQKSGSSDPIPGAGIELRSTGDGAKTYVVVATKVGRFVITDIPAGEYRLAATHPGFVRSEYGQRGPNGSGIRFHLTSGQELKDIRISLVETGAISGRIYDRNGTPLENVQVQAFKSVYEYGRRIFRPVRVTTTNDLGAYRLFWLPPGDYYIGATPLGAVAPNLIRETEPYGGIATRSASSPTGKPIRRPNDELSVPSYFPGVPDPQSAAAIQLRAGANIQAIDITFREGTSHSISGAVSGLPNTGSNATSPSGRSSRVRLEPRGPIAIENGGFLRSIDSSTGTFEFSQVLPGAYNLCANASAFSGCLPVEVRNADVAGIRLPLTPDLDIRAHVSFDRRPGFDEAIAVARLNLLTIPDASGTTLRRASNEFLYRGLRTGEPYRIGVESLPDTGYVKSIRTGDISLLESEFRFNRAPDAPIEIVVGLDAGTLSGTVVGNTGAPAAAVTVLIVPNVRSRIDLYRKAATGVSGEFRIAGLAPGDYTVLAFDDIEEGAWWDPDFIPHYSDLGKSVHVNPDTEQTIQLSSIP